MEPLFQHIRVCPVTSSLNLNEVLLLLLGKSIISLLAFQAGSSL